MDPLDLNAAEQRDKQRSADARNARATDDADLKWLMGTPRGRRIVWGILDRAGTFGNGFDTNAMQMARSAGKREEGIRWFGALMRVCPDLYAEMTREANGTADSGSRNDQ